MGRMVFGLCLGFALVAGAIYWARTCLPDPNERGVEWLRREDVIVVQMKETQGLPQPGIVERLTMPVFTLYGDGTLILADPKEGLPLTRTTIPAGTIRDLLEYVRDEGFFYFNYEQPQPTVFDSKTTYFYVNSKPSTEESTESTTNSVSAYALDWTFGEGSEWGEFRSLQKIRDRLARISAEARGNAEATAYSPTVGRLIAVSVVATDFIGVPFWPFPEVEVPLAGEEGEAKERALSSDEVSALNLEDAGRPMCWNQVQYNDLLVDVCYRPALPYEENFPEFDPPSP